MEGTKAAATVHSQVLQPLSRHSSLRLTCQICRAPAPKGATGETGVSAFHHLTSCQRAEAARSPVMAQPTAHTHAGSERRQENREPLLPQPLLSVSLANNSQKDRRRFGWVLPWAGNRAFIQQLLCVGRRTGKGEQNISSPLKLKDTNWSCALPLAGCVTSSKWLCLSEPHLYDALGADPA